MKAIMLMFDSLNRHMLQPYGCSWTKTPNFQRLAERTVTFDNAYVGSMPCMPARRELHTGRYNFLHRSWGPLEPFDDSMPRLLKENGVSSHLYTDHYHYWEAGGATYHTQYSTYEFFRGQEGEPWKADLTDNVQVPPTLHPSNAGFRKQDWVNRHYIQNEEDFPQAKTMAAGMEFLRTNHKQDNWFLQIETFDPHEPFYAHQKYRDLYPHEYDGPSFDWPPYGKVTESPEAIRHMRMEYAALLSMCDAYLGKVLDLMDELQLWDDTLLIVNTDHGFLLSEHDHWAKCAMPFWNEIAHIPLFIWDPRVPIVGERRQALVQTIDLPAHILEFFRIEAPKDMKGKSLRHVMADDSPIRKTAIYGLHGAHVNITDGRYVYMRPPVREDSAPLFNYTLMPTHMRGPFSTEELANLELEPPFPFTKGCKTLKIDASGSSWKTRETKKYLYDLQEDPRQERPIDDNQTENYLVRHLVGHLIDNNAPTEQFVRLGLTAHIPTMRG